MNGRGTMPRLPRNAPPIRGNAVVRKVCAAVLRASGWRFAGTLPDVPKLVLIAAPHSSWWDGVLGLLFKFAVGVDISFMAKSELFRGGLGWILRRVGAIPVERTRTHGVVDQMVQRFGQPPPLWLGIAPEGTRRAVQAWRSGFWHIARAASVPILPVYFDYPSRTVGVGALFFPDDDVAADLETLRDLYRPYRGRHRGV